MVLPQKEWVFENPPSHETNACTSSEVFESLQFKTTQLGQSCLALLQGCTRQYKFSKIVQKQPSMQLNTQRLEIMFLRCSQNTSFTEQLQALSKGKPLGHKDTLHPLGTFLDDDGLILATGRLTEAPPSWAT